MATIEIFIEKTNETLTEDVSKFKTAKDIVKFIEENLNGVIITVNGEVVLEEYEVQENDKFKILSVVSGG